MNSENTLSGPSLVPLVFCVHLYSNRYSKYNLRFASFFWNCFGLNEKRDIGLKAGFDKWGTK